MSLWIMCAGLFQRRLVGSSPGGSTSVRAAAPAIFRINNADGYANAAIYLNNSVNFYNINANGQTTDIGELGGVTTAFIGAGGSQQSHLAHRREEHHEHLRGHHRGCRRPRR